MFPFPRSRTAPLGVRFLVLSGAVLAVACSSTPPPADRDPFTERVRAATERACTRQAISSKLGVLRVERVSPGEGPRFGTTRLTLEGWGFAPGSRVEVGGVACESIHWQSASRLSCEFTPSKAMLRPSSAQHSYDVRVTHPNGACGVNPQAFSLVSRVEIAPRTAQLGPSNRIRFSSRHGVEPIRYQVIEGDARIDERTGELRAGNGPGTVVVRATDAIGTSDEAIVQISAPLRLSPGSQEAAVSERVWFTASGGVPPYRYSVRRGSGTIDARGGMFVATGVTGKTVIEVRDVLENLATSEIRVLPELSLVASAERIAVGNRVSLQVRGGVPPYRWVVQPERGRLEMLDASEATFVASDVPGPASLRVEDSRGSVRLITLEVAPRLIARAPQKEVLVGDSLALQVAGGVPPYRYELREGAGKVDPATGTYFAPKQKERSSIVITDTVGNSMAVAIAVSEGGFAARKVSAGYAHTCAVIDQGVHCWGEGRQGQLGGGDTEPRSRPMPVKGLERNVIAVSVGFYHSCALLVGGGVKCWGDNRYGQLGNGTTNSSSTAVSVVGLTAGVTAISSGQFHVCAVKNFGVVCWGDNRRGQLGDGTRESSSVPVRVRGLPPAMEYVGAGSFHSCAGTHDKAWCWGFNRAGQLGNGKHKETSVPVAVRGLEGELLAIDAKGSHSCAVVSDAPGGVDSSAASVDASGPNHLVCWGYNGPGQIGDETTEFRYVPKRVSRISRSVSALSLGYTHTCAALDGGQALRCWGNNVNGQLGDESSIQYQPAPVPVNGIPGGIRSIATGVDHSCALLEDSLWCWGVNRTGSFGNGGQQGSRAPLRSFWLKDHAF